MSSTKKMRAYASRIGNAEKLAQAIAEQRGKWKRLAGFYLIIAGRLGIKT